MIQPFCYFVTLKFNNKNLMYKGKPVVIATNMPPGLLY